ncbi:MAG: hypothetical protein H7Y07_08020 [Pyrinomonadaceae bacterium]|nr:hypothetical protein [Sphingobacteriaceae bacterium]
MNQPVNPNESTSFERLKDEFRSLTGKTFSTDLAAYIAFVQMKKMEIVVTSLHVINQNLITCINKVK